MNLAVAFHGVPEKLKEACRERLNGDTLEVVDRFMEKIGKR